MSYLTVQQAATQLNVHPQTIRRMAQRGELPTVRVGRHYRVMLPALGGAA